MSKLILEIGMKLDKSLVYYHDLLLKNGLNLNFSCITHDVYYTKNNLEGLSEKQMKNACIRLRYCDVFNQENTDKSELLNKEK